MDSISTLTQEFTSLLDVAIERKASDLHIAAGNPPTLRIDGQLRSMDQAVYSPEHANELLSSFIGHELFAKIQSTRKELDFSFTYKGLRFRCNVFYSLGNLCASFRVLVNQVPELGTLGVPPIITKLIDQNQGLMVVTGPTGHGKSTTLAAMVKHLAESRRARIITIEDPIEYTFTSEKSVISQREVGADTPSFATALRSSLREDPDVVMLGEMRDLETIETALQLAETGHLVITTLHTNSAAQTADRIVSVFPSSQQPQIRQQLADVLLGIVSQRLIPRIQGGRVLVSEVLTANSAVRSILREGKTHQLPNLIQTSAAEGMISLEKSMADLVSRGEISIDDALKWAIDPKNLKMLIY